MYNGRLGSRSAPLPPEAFAYVAGGAATGSTIRRNREAFERWRIVPRVLRDVSARDLSVELLDTRLPAPILLAPIGVLEMADEEADLAVARAAAATSVPFIFSSQASRSMEECAEVMGASPRWFQLYWSKADDLVASFVRRAERCGCSAIVLTLDTTLLGWRPQDLDLGYLPFLRGKGIAQYTSDPVFRAGLRADAATDEAAEQSEEGPRPPLNLRALGAALEMSRRFPGGTVRALRSGAARAAVRKFISTYSRPSLEWDDLARLRAMTGRLQGRRAGRVGGAPRAAVRLRSGHRGRGRRAGGNPEPDRRPRPHRRSRRLPLRRRDHRRGSGRALIAGGRSGDGPLRTARSAHAAPASQRAPSRSPPTISDG